MPGESVQPEPDAAPRRCPGVPGQGELLMSTENAQTFDSDNSKKRYATT
jgi:hypothetical protein